MFEHWLAGLRGRFVSFIHSTRLQRFYLDPMGSLAAVYSNDSPVIASTWSLIKNPGAAELNIALKGYPCNEPCKYYPAGPTRTDDVARLLPNFYLCLDSWKPKRHWPSIAIQSVSEEGALAQREHIAQHIGENIAAAATNAGIYIGATAGQDARLIVGCVPDEMRDTTNLVTFAPRRKGQSAISDLQIGEKVAQATGLKRIIVSVPDNDPVMMTRFLLRLGVAAGAGKGMDYYQAARNTLDLEKTWLTGFGGAILRTFCFRDHETSRRPYSEDELLRSIELPSTERLRTALKEWRATLPHESGRFLLDQLYYEIRHGCWTMPLQYGTANFRRNLTPFSSRYLIETCYSFPHHVRRNLGLFVLAAVSPELANVPYNTLTGRKLAMRRLLSNRFYRIPIGLGRR